MFLWLLVFNQWKRLRPFYLPTGALLFLVIAAPWHILAALRNATWVHRYLVYEHFERFTSPAASRPGAWWYFVPIVLLGLFPWTGFLWPGLREALRGGWAARRRTSTRGSSPPGLDLFFCFSPRSHSKLPAYVLPVFPAPAVLIGRWLAQAPDEGAARLRPGLRCLPSSADCWPSPCWWRC